MTPGADHKWHFDKRLSLDTLFGIVGVAAVLGGPILVWGRAMESRVLAVEIREEQRVTIEKDREKDRKDERQQFATRLERFDEQVTAMRIVVGQLSAQLTLMARPGR